ncbi:uncharacterized protein DS421_13g430390 [Arachis hypogaea]|nr:uncharacterized protein DS421_13g430390 [Arachis hypogaea]
MAGIHKIAGINPTIDNLCVRIRVLRLWTLPSYENSPLPNSIEMVWLDEDTGGTTNVNATRPHMLLQKLSNVQVVPSPFFHNSKDVDYTGGLLLISNTFSIIEGEKVEGAKNLLFEFSNEVAASDESELLENAITPTKRLSSESEESKVEGDTSTCKKIKIEKET